MILMRAAGLALGLALGATAPLSAQEAAPLFPPSVDSMTLAPAPQGPTGPTERAEPQDEVAQGLGAVLRGLDKINALTEDLTLTDGETGQLGRLSVSLQECRYPVDDPLANAYAFVTIREAGGVDPVFRGWMIAGSPALNPLNHPRYDVWVLRCTTS